MTTSGVTRGSIQGRELPGGSFSTDEKKIFAFPNYLSDLQKKKRKVFTFTEARRPEQ